MLNLDANSLVNQDSIAGIIIVHAGRLSDRGIDQNI